MAQRVSYLALHSSFFGPDGAVTLCVIMIILSLTALTLCIQYTLYVNKCHHIVTVITLHVHVHVQCSSTISIHVV